MIADSRVCLTHVEGKDKIFAISENFGKTFEFSSLQLLPSNFSLISFMEVGEFLFLHSCNSSSLQEQLYVSKIDETSFSRVLFSDRSQIPRNSFLQFFFQSDSALLMGVFDSSRQASLYFSDGDAQRFSSLKKRVPIYGERLGFGIVKSLEGVYILNQIIEHSNRTETLITFESGGSWKPLNAPTNHKCSSTCYLNLLTSTISKPTRQLFCSGKKVFL